MGTSCPIFLSCSNVPVVYNAMYMVTWLLAGNTPSSQLLYAMCRCVRVPARDATRAELETVHTPPHVESMFNLTALTPLARAELSSTFSSM